MSKIGEIVLFLTIGNLEKVTNFLKTLSPDDFSVDDEPSWLPMQTGVVESLPDKKQVEQPPAPPEQVKTEGVPPAPPAQPEKQEQASEQGTPPTPPVQSNIELDKNGIPWDERIHASTKTKNADGTWRNLRGVDKTLLAQVEAELKAKYSGSPAPVQTEQNAPPTPPAQTEQSTPPTPPVQTEPVKDYIYIIQRLGQVDQAKLNDLIKQYQLESLAALHGKPELVPIICDELGI